MSSEKNLKQKRKDGLDPPDGYVVREIGPGPVWVSWELNHGNQGGVSSVLADERSSLRTDGDGSDRGHQKT